MDVLQTQRDLQQQISQFGLRERLSLRLLPADGVAQTSTSTATQTSRSRLVKSPVALAVLTVTVLVLNDHVVVLCPCRVIADDVWVVSENGVCVHFLQGQLPEESERCSH